jgi:hypothetical protein
VDIAIVALVILARLFVPLLIIRWPLPAILACLLIDAADQTIFQAVVPEADLSGYQSYDKALDIYYLTIAYISTLRNWTNRFAVPIVRFLFYYRLVGVVLFEFSGVRELLLIFPNTFEYVFIFYEAVRVRWDPTRMSKRLLIGATAFIWIVIKLPQEWWIHVAQLDTTDVMKEVIFGVSVDATWREAIANRPWVLLVTFGLVALAAFGAWWLFANRLPPADRPITLDADAEETREVRPSLLLEVRERIAGSLFDRQLLEKVVLVTLVGVIFAQVLGVDAGPVALGIGLAVIIVANAAVSDRLVRRGERWVSALSQFLAMLVTNILLYALLVAGAAAFGISVALDRAGFFLLLMSLIVALYDRYRPEYLARFMDEGP